MIKAKDGDFFISDWQKRDAARARMRMTIKKLLKKYKYQPEGMEDALETVMLQCQLWTDRESGDEVWQDILRMEREENNAEKYPTAEG